MWMSVLENVGEIIKLFYCLQTNSVILDIESNKSEFLNFYAGKRNNLK
jgi:hypothetical protein